MKKEKDKSKATLIPKETKYELKCSSVSFRLAGNVDVSSQRVKGRINRFIAD